MIKRRKDYSKKAPSKEASKIYIVCEGKETERGYFEFFEGLSSNLELIIIPPEDGTDPLKLMELAHRLFLSETGRYSLDFRSVIRSGLQSTLTLGKRRIKSSH